MSQKNVPSRLCLCVTNTDDPHLPAALDQALATGHIASVMFQPAEEVLAMENLITLAQEKAVAAIVDMPKIKDAEKKKREDIQRQQEEDFAHIISLARSLGADGVQIPATEQFYESARNSLGEDAIVGGMAGFSRHGAMTVAELGADYVAFGPARKSNRSRGEWEFPALVSWWAETFTVPVVAWEILDRMEAGQLARKGVEFLALAEDVWRTDAPDQAVAAYHAAITQLRENEGDD